MDRSTISEIIDAYGSDFKSADGLQIGSYTPASIRDQLTNLKSIVDYLNSLTLEQRGYFSDRQLILVMPATNATSERCFSALRRLKTWHRATTFQQGLIYCFSAKD